jgi:hypothetical protein
VADHNPEFGVFLFEANAGMTLSNLSSNGHSTPTGCHGAGLLVDQSSVVAVTGTVFSANCVSICNSESTVAIGSDMFDSNATDLGHEPGLLSSHPRHPRDPDESGEGGTRGGSVGRRIVDRVIAPFASSGVPRGAR